MTASAQPSARLSERGGPALAHPAAGDSSRTGPWPAWMPAAPALVTLAVTVWGIGGASFWRDEAATLTATRRSLPEMIRMLAHVDGVHGAYYLVMWPLAHLFGTGEVVMRLPSAVAMAAAAFGTAVIGRRVVTPATGLLAGLVFATLPLTSRFGQEARSYGFVTAAAVLASYLLIRAAGEQRRRWAAGYGLSLAALGLLNMFALLIIPAHGITLALARRHGLRESGHAAGRADSRDMGTGDGWATGSARGWVIAAAVACAAIVPTAAAAWHERHQLGWLRKPTAHDVWVLATLLTGSAALFVLITALGVTGGWHALRARPGSARRRLMWLSLPWLFVPPAVLIAVSEIKPVYVYRYVVFCLPALALLAGCGLAAVGRYWRIPAVGLLAVLTLPMQHAIRQPSGHGDNIRAAAQFLRAQTRAGDAVVWFKPGFRDLGAVYPYGFSRLRDIGLKDTATAMGNLSGTEVPLPVLEQRLGGVARVWLVEVDRNQPDPAVIRSPQFRLIRVWSHGDMALRLYSRSGR